MMLDLVKNIARPLKEAAITYLNHYNDSAYLEWYFKHSKHLAKFKNLHQGESCFIIGNGPSLNKTNLAALRDYHTFGLNKIYLMLNKVDLNLSYHVAVNPFVIEQSVKEFESMTCPSFLSYKAARGVIHNLNDVYFITTGGPYTFQPNLLKEIPEGHTVTYVAMQIAFYMGFSKVFLIGVDHNFKATGSPDELQTLQGEDANHFDPQYFGNQQWQLPNLEASELSYQLARFFFKRAGGQIYDATIDGNLQIFPKISFEQALDMCTKKTDRITGLA